MAVEDADTGNELGGLAKCGMPMITWPSALIGNGPSKTRRRSSEVLAPLGLHSNPDKTRIVCLTNGAEGLTSWGSTITRWSPGSGEVIGICNAGRRSGP